MVADQMARSSSLAAGQYSRKTAVNFLHLGFHTAETLNPLRGYCSMARRSTGPREVRGLTELSLIRVIWRRSLSFVAQRSSFFALRLVSSRSWKSMRLRRGFRSVVRPWIAAAPSKPRVRTVAPSRSQFARQPLFYSLRMYEVALCQPCGQCAFNQAKMFCNSRGNLCVRRSALTPSL